MATKTAAKRGEKYAPVRSVRVGEPTWKKASKRAEREGLTMSEVIFRFVQGYADGDIAAPQMQMVYTEK